MQAPIMKFIRVISTAGIFLFFGAMVPIYAQQDKQGRPDKSEKGGQP
jgi:hypothetical protein